MYPIRLDVHLLIFTCFHSKIFLISVSSLSFSICPYRISCFSSIYTYDDGYFFFRNFSNFTATILLDIKLLLTLNNLNIIKCTLTTETLNVVRHLPGTNLFTCDLCCEDNKSGLKETL